MANITVLGLGYIGLPTATALANAGHTVYGFDIDLSIKQRLDAGDHAYLVGEPDLQNALRGALECNALQITPSPRQSDVYIFCVPTPVLNSGDGYAPCLEALNTALESIMSLIKSDDLIIVESTVPVGTCEALYNRIQSTRPDIEVSICYCPERVLPGNILHELKTNSRIIGGLNPESAQRAVRLYQSIVSGPIRTTDCKTAELCKLAENSFRDVNIAFANEIAQIAEEAGVNPWSLITLANEHPRVNILSPGPGVGGHCIAVDPWFLINQFPETSKLIRAGRETNSNKPKVVVDRILATAKEYKATKIAILGLTYKPNVNDTRESPASKIANLIAAQGLNTLCVEPNLKSHPSHTLWSLEDALNDADMVVALVRHRDFEHSDLIKKWTKPLVDACGLVTAAS